MPDEEAGQRDDERRDTDVGDDRPLGSPDCRADGECRGDRHESSPRDLVPTRRIHELGRREGTDPGHVADREVDLAEQEDEHDAVGEHRGPGHLDDDVDEVLRGEEVGRLEAEEDDDEDLPEDDREDAEIARLDIVERAAIGTLESARLLVFGSRPVLTDDLDPGRGHAGAPACVAGMPETLVGTPAVIACTTSSCVVFSRS